MNQPSPIKKPTTDAELVQEAFEAEVLEMLQIYFVDFVSDAAGAGERLQKGMGIARHARSAVMELLET